MKQYFIILCLLATILYGQELLTDELLDILSPEPAIPTDKVSKLVDEIKPKTNEEQRTQINGYMNEALKNYDDILNNIDKQNDSKNVEQQDNNQNNQTKLTEEQSQEVDSYINEALKNYDDIIQKNADNAKNHNESNSAKNQQSLEQIKKEEIRKKLLEQLKDNESVRKLLLEQLKKLE